MKILIVSSFLPYPLHSGGHIRLYNLILRLSKNHEITLICEKRKNQRAEDIEQLSRICKKVYTVERQKQWSLKNILLTGFSFNSFLITGHTNSKFKTLISGVLKEESFDVIHVETSYVFQNLPQNTSVPVVLVEHNLEYMVYRRFAQNAFFLIRPLLYLDTIKLEKIEKSFWKRATKLVAVSDSEAKVMNADAIVPNGVDTEKFKPVSGGDKILFIGDFKWIQNRDSAKFILKDIWPKLNIPEKLWIVGRKIPEDIKSLGSSGVIFDQDSPADTYEIYKKTKVLLAPIRVGGGTSFKILECMASGVPVVTTALGNAGINAVNGKSIIIAETDLAFADAVNNLLKDEKLYKEIAKNARDLIMEKYNWDIIVNKLEKVYKDAIV